MLKYIYKYSLNGSFNIYMFSFTGSIVIILTENCHISPHVDECGNVGLLWNCSGLNLYRLPILLPPELKNQNVTLDLSFNQFISVTEDTFEHIATHSNITSVILHHNNITEIGNTTFQKMSNLCCLDLSNSHLEKSTIDPGAFLNTSSLKFLRIDQNEFQHDGYPYLSFSKLTSLTFLTIDIFSGFSFTKAFENLENLSELEFNSIGIFRLSNTSFLGLKNSPIRSITMDFRYHVCCDVTEDLFCSFPVISREIVLNFGGYCDVIVALRSLKCLQNRKVESISLSSNKKRFESGILILNNWTMEYLANICVKNLSLGYNSIVFLNATLYKTTLWKCLEKFDFHGNNMHVIDVSTLMSLLTLPKIRILNLCCNNPPTSKTKYRDDPFQIQKHRFIYVNITLSKNLKLLDISDNYFHNTNGWNLRFVLIGEELEELYLQKTNFPLHTITKLIFPNLIKLNLSENSFRQVHSDMFQGVRNLHHLYVLDVGLNNTAHSISNSLFKNLKNLLTLDFSKNGLAFLPSLLLMDQKHSLTEIRLDHNRFSAVPSVLTELKELKTLYVRFNLISKFSRNDQRLFQSLSNLSIYIEGNPITCACTGLQSLKWMKAHQNIFYDLNKVLCVESKIPIVRLLYEKEWRKFELNCQTDDWLVFSVCLLFFTIVSLTIIASVKRYRVHLEYVILRLKNRWKGVHQKKQRGYVPI